MKTFGIKDKIDDLAEQTQGIAETAYKIALIEATEKVTKLATSAIIISVLMLLGNFLLLFLGFGVAKWVGDMFNDIKMGYFIVGGFYLLLILIIVISSKKIIIPYFRNIIVKKLYE